MLMHPDHFQNWLDFGHGLLIFLLLVSLWFRSNLGFRGISWRMHRGNGLKFCMRMYPDHFQHQHWSDYSLSLLIFLILCYFDLVKWVKFGVSRHFPENAWREWPEILHADVSWPPSELIRFWSCSVDFPHYGAPWLSETGHTCIWILQALSGKCLGVNVEGGVEAYVPRFGWSSVYG